jgi:predicted P-loop ATPase
MDFDFDKLRRDYPLPDVIRASGVALTADGDEFRACCPFHGEKTPSFTVFRKSGADWKYHCFGCGEHGDVLDYVQEYYGLGDDVVAAARHLTGEAPRAAADHVQPAAEERDAYAGYEIIPPPADAPLIQAKQRTPPLLNPKRIDPKTGQAKVVTYTPSMVFPYHTKGGRLLGYVLRVEIDGKKLTPGIWWTRHAATGWEGWSHGSYPEPRPLMGLPELAEHPDWQVLLVEGEKCKTAAKDALADKRIVPVTWMGGGKAIKKVYWASLKGRRVVIWPDNDLEGWRTTMGYVDSHGHWHDGLLDLLYAAGVAAIKVVHITPESRADGWDIADAYYGTRENDFQDRLEPAAISAIIRDRIQEWPLERFKQWRQARLDEWKAKSNEQDNGPGPGAPGDDPDRTQGGAGERPGAGQAPAPGGEVVQRGRGYGIDEETWRAHLVMKADGEGLLSSSLQNFSLLLQYERRFSGIFAWNDFAQEVYLMRRPPWEQHIDGPWTPRQLTDPDVISTACWLEYCGMRPKVTDVGKVIQRVAQHNHYNPVVEALEALVWDGEPRLMGGQGKSGKYSSWLTRYLGAADKPINRVFGTKWMISGVARALNPGCKVDTMLILEGQQGLKKSSALRAISDGLLPGVFTDEITDVGSKDAGLQMQGMLIIEISELDAMRKAEVSTLKAWLSRQVDRFRRPYGKIVEAFPRHCVFAGTVNPHGTGYLKDPTGARRFWPVSCGEIDLAMLKRDAAQLWAEAVHLYKQGWPWWLENEENDLAHVEQQARYEHDPWAQMIDAYLAEHYRTEVTTLTIMDKLEVPRERRSSIVNSRIVAHLLAIGWTQAPGRDGVFVAPSNLV